MQIVVYPLVFSGGSVLALKDNNGSYRLPQALLRGTETLMEAAQRALKKETGIVSNNLQFVGIYDAVDRNPSERQLAAVLLARSWQNDIILPYRNTEYFWIGNFNSETFILDQNSILLEQGVFSRLSIQENPPKVTAHA